MKNARPRPPAWRHDAEPWEHASFFDERCVRSLSFSVPASTLHGAYVAWCYRRGERPACKRMFGIELQRIGCIPIRTALARRWRGIQLR